MIIAAAPLATAKDGYLLADVQEMGFLRDNTFDLVVSYLNNVICPTSNPTAERSFAF